MDIDCIIDGLIGDRTFEDGNYRLVFRKSEPSHRPIYIAAVLRLASGHLTCRDHGHPHHRHAYAQVPVYIDTYAFMYCYIMMTMIMIAMKIVMIV